MNSIIGNRSAWSASAVIVAVALLGAAPRLFAAAADQTGGMQKVYVTNSLGDNITVIDLKTMSVIDNLMVGEKPHGVCFQADGRRLFTTIESEKVLKVIDTATDKVIDTIPLTGRPNQCGATPNGKFVAIPIRDGNSFDIVDITQKKVVKVLPGKLPHNCYNTGDDHQMFCTAMDEKAVHRINLDTLTSVQQIPVGAIPRPLAITKDAKTLYTSVTNLHGFLVIDIPTEKVVQTVEFPPAPFGAEPMEPNTPTHGLQITPNGKELWVAGIVDDAVFVYDMATKRVVKRIPAGHGPNWLAFSSDGKYCVVSNAGTNDVSIMDTATRTEVARVPVGKAPKRIVVVSTPGV